MLNSKRPCTIYTRYTNQAGQIKIIRRVLENCVFIDAGNTIALRTGVVLSQQFFCMVFNQDDLLYIPAHEWRNLTEPELDGKYSIEWGSSGCSYIVDHFLDYEFPGNLPDGWYSNSSTATTAENAKFRTAATAEPGSYSIANKPEEHRKGATPRSQHIFIRC
jgi:hypothetical protein